MAGSQLMHVPYKGMLNAINDLMGGQNITSETLTMQMSLVHDSLQSQLIFPRRYRRIYVASVQ